MIFTEARFLLFFAAVWGLFWALPSERGRKLLLLAASYLFYGAWDVRFLTLIWVSTGVDYLVGRALESSRDPRARRRWLLLSLVTNLGLLGFFKYYDFFVTSAADLLAALGLEASPSTLGIILPVGISFYTFQTLSYTVDVYRGELAAERSLLNLALFVGFFPQLVAGPIVRARDFLPQLAVPRLAAEARLRWGAGLFAVGYFKKAVLSDHVAPLVDAFFSAPDAFTHASAWLASGLYSVQIYCDFSGYSDMAIGAAAMLGYRLADNFYFPYLGANPREFWRRWHISLSTWLRDYLFIPLGGSRGGPVTTQRNLMLTMVLGGLWHGAAWTYVIWGAIHGVALVGHRAWRLRFPATVNPFASAGAPFNLRAVLARLGAWLAFAVWLLWTWFFFRAQSLSDAFSISASALGLGPSGERFLDPRWWLFLAALLFVHRLVSHASLRHAVIGWNERAPAWQLGLVWGAAAAALLPLVPVDPQPFIYFQF